MNERSGPGTNYSTVGTLSDGTTIQIACQTSGTDVGGTSVWDQLSDGAYVSDYYTNTPVPYGFSPPIPQCTAPPASPTPSAPTSTTYQVVIPGQTNGTVGERSGPGTNYSLVGTIGDGTSITISCQTSGTDVDGTTVWDQIGVSSFISDYYTNTPVPYGFSPTIPQCTSVPPVPSEPSTSTTYLVAIPDATNGTVNERSGPGTSYSIVGTINDDATIVISCQIGDTTVGGTSVWDQINGGPFISDYYTNTPTVDGFTPSLPQCASPPASPGNSPSPGSPSTVGAVPLGRTVAANPFQEDDFCTWYTEVRFHDFVSNYSSMYPAGHTYINVGGNAYAWKASAIAHGWTVTTTPTVNSIVVFQPGVEGSDLSDGHVAWVTDVRPNGHFTVAELNAYLPGNIFNSGYRPDVNTNYHATAGVSFILIPT